MAGGARVGIAIDLPERHARARPRDQLADRREEPQITTHEAELRLDHILALLLVGEDVFDRLSVCLAEINARSAGLSSGDGAHHA